LHRAGRRETTLPALYIYKKRERSLNGGKGVPSWGKVGDESGRVVGKNVGSSQGEREEY